MLSTQSGRMKIKFDIGSGEIRNVWAFVLRRLDGIYELYFDNGSWDKCIALDTKRRAFYGAD